MADIEWVDSLRGNVERIVAECADPTSRREMTLGYIEDLLTRALAAEPSADDAVVELRSLRTVVARVVRQGGGVAQLREHLATMPAGDFARGGLIHTPEVDQ